jgi:hypothetical protein
MSYPGVKENNLMYFFLPGLQAHTLSTTLDTNIPKVYLLGQGHALWVPFSKHACPVAGIVFFTHVNIVLLYQRFKKCKDKYIVALMFLRNME